ncbi:MAG: FAD-binding oxidoreductase [Bdellovibrionales bacterium]|nr:FAD-binding oxidoreductase [Bdellovibrionales bacterium]
MSVSFWNDFSTDNQIYSDIAIIGGGIAGLSLAYWLQKEDPNLKVCLIEKGLLGSGATGRNAGFITCGSVEHFNRLVGTYGEQKALEIWKFSETNLSLLKSEIFSSLKIEDIEFEHNGSFSLASTEKEFEELKKSAQIMKKLNINVEVLTDLQILDRLGAEKFVGGIKYQDDASVHPVKLLQAIQSKITNVTFLENNEVFHIENHGSEKTILTNKSKITTSAVCYCTNGYSSLLNPYFGDKVFPTRGQILITEPVKPFMEGPCYANFVLDYFRQLPSGRIIIGGFRQLQKDVELGFSDETSPIIQSALENFINQHLPMARGKKVTHRWSGVMGFSSDGQPFIGSLPNDPQSFFNVGFTAHGLGLSFHTSKCLVDLMFGRDIPQFLTAKRLS